MSSKRLDHADAGLLLPWLGTDRLAQDELEGLLDHLKVCAPCRRELRDLAELGRFAELAEREEAPDAAAIERRLAGLLGRLEPGRPAAARPMPAASTVGKGRAWGKVLPFAALVVLAAGLWAYRGGTGASGPARLPAGPYATLSNAAPAAAVAGAAVAGAAVAGAALRVVVADGCGQAELRGLLLEAGAEIRGGPTRHGVYTVALPAGDATAAEALIAAWRPLPCFAFVEKAAGS